MRYLILIRGISFYLNLNLNKRLKQLEIGIALSEADIAKVQIFMGIHKFSVSSFSFFNLS